MIATPQIRERLDYETLFQRIKTVPTQYLDEIRDFVDFVLYRSAQPEPKNKQASTGLEEFYGCMDFEGDPLEIQKRMRNEWN
ncbi:MAG: DUF2281 domain-containing protein [Bacteroidales bacterium]|nr:DUF2281 domain-containing protein [Bacteroidales bacterium]